MPSITTVLVTCLATRPDGSVIANALFRFALSAADTQNGIIVPREVTATAGPDGIAVAHLWPNSLGAEGTTYRVYVSDPSARHGEFDLGDATVPTVACNLYQILNLGAPPTVDVATLAKLAAQQAAAEAAVSASAAHSDRTQADLDAVATAADRVQTGLDRVATGADRVQTGLDRVQTSADRTQTGADRVQTGLDRTSTTASASAAAGSASAAAGSAASASSSASTTAALMAAFQGVFLGDFASDAAAVSFAGAHSIAIVDGIMYQNTVSDKFRIYNGTSWQDYDSSAAASQSAAALSATAAAGSAAAAAGSAATATAVLSDSGFVAVKNDLTNIDAVAGSISSVNTVAGDHTIIGTVAGDHALIVTVAGDHSAIVTVAGDHAAIVTVATDHTAINTVAGDHTVINTVAGDHAAINTVAGDHTAIATIVADKANIDAVAGDLTNINLVAADKANIDAVAGDLSNINAVQAALTTINSAGANATAAASSATAAAASATAAAASASSAAAIVLGVASNKPSVRPTLLIDFAQMGKLDPRITFGRASSAMAYDGKTTVKAEENLVTYSQDYTQSAWTKNNTTNTANTVAAPDGTTTASTLAGNAGTATKSIYCTAGSVSIAANNLATQSFFVKYNTHQFVQLYVGTDATDYVNFDLVNGLATAYGSSTTSGSITNVGNGWWRISMTWLYAAGASTGGSLCLVDSLTAARASTSASTNSIYLWGAQVEQRSYATAYTPTTTAAITNYLPALQSYAANVARFDFNPTTGESLGLMVEEQRTNLALYSQQFDAATWTKNYGSIFANAAIAPDGTLTAAFLREDATNNGHYLAQQISISNSTAYTYSTYLKAGSRTRALLYNTTSAGGSVFDLSAGTVVGSVGNAPTSSVITTVGNGWYRCSVTFTSAGTSVAIQLYTVSTGSTFSYTGDGYSGLYAWGAQLEAGAFATSYIPTLLTYSGRGSVATYVGDNGLIQTAAANVARYQRNIAGAVQLLLEGASSNLVTFSSDFTQTTWLKTVAGTGVAAVVMQNYGIAPDGSFTADRIQFNRGAGGTASDYSLLQVNTGASSATYAHSIWLKSNTGSNQNVVLYDTTGSVIVVTPVWQRFTFTNGSAAANPSLLFGTRGGTGFYYTGGDQTLDILAWGAQIEAIATTSYIPSSDSFTSRSGSASYFDPSGVMRYAPSGLARYDFDPVTGLSKGLLLEAAGTNLALYSEQFDSATYYKSNATITANAVAAPDGNTTADQLVEDTTGGVAHRAYQTGITVASGSAYTTSIFVKANGRTQAMLQYYDGTTNAFVFFDLSAVSVLSNTGASNATITALNNGWRRLTITAAAGSTSAGIYINAASGGTQVYTGDGASGLYLWGFQLESGYIATSYIPTTTAQVTRAADVGASVANSRAADVWSSAQVTRSSELPSMIGSALTALLPLNEYTLYAEGSINQGAVASTNYHLVTLTDSTGANYTKLRIQGNNLAAGAVVTVAGSVLGTTQGAVTANTPSKMAIGVKADSHALSLAGMAVAAFTGAVPKGIDRMYIGTGETGSNQMLNGYIKRIAILPKRVINTEIQGLTS